MTAITPGIFSLTSRPNCAWKCFFFHLYNGNFFVKADLKRLDKKDGKIFWDISLTEGKNREIKKIFMHFESKVTSLHRYKFADIELKSLKTGDYRKLNKRELNKIQKI